MWNNVLGNALIDGVDLSQVIFQELRGLEGAAADVTVDNPAGVRAVDQVVVPLGAAETGEGLCAGQTLAANAVRQPGHSHVVDGHVIGATFT